MWQLTIFAFGAKRVDAYRRYPPILVVLIEQDRRVAEEAQRRLVDDTEVDDRAEAEALIKKTEARRKAAQEAEDAENTLHGNEE